MNVNYDMLRKDIITLEDRAQESGEYCVNWNGKDCDGKDVSSGVYFCTLIFNNKSTTNKMLLVR